LRGKNLLTLIKAPFLLLIALLQTFKVFLNLKPDVVLGMGGFASGLGGIEAWLLRIPLVVHEQNSIPGTDVDIKLQLANNIVDRFRA
jgi:UDP-N-acetylglucosamine--N-acetylmuramyl-(pentapeptide) pyrophosphoryl-undecaprenol N-acetylglucosamine transferase